MIYLLISNLITIIAVILAYTLGLKNGQKVQSKQEINVMPNPIKAYKEHCEAKEEKKEIEKLNTILQNVDNYDGTSIGQKEVI